MGYIGNKMSVRAYEAYESGEKPLSKEFERAPRGTAALFKQIEKKVKK